MAILVVTFDEGAAARELHWEAAKQAWIQAQSPAQTHAAPVGKDGRR